MIFTIKGWTNVVGFHTRNVPHKGHEYIMKTALERENADGLLMHPIIGPKKKGDFKSDVILNAYDALLKGKFNNKALLAGFPTYSRYAGPREAVFTAICRKNYGCRYFIVGRDHTGVGDFYETDGNRRLFESLGELGITPVYFDAIGYDRNSGEYNTKDGLNKLETITATRFREAILKGEFVPDWFVRKSVQELLLSELSMGRKIFHE